MTPAEQSRLSPLRLISEIWREIFLGVGMWGAIRPILAAILAAVLDCSWSTFQSKHQRAFDWTLLQIPLALTIVLYVPLWLWSIYVAWRDATVIVSQARSS